MSSLSATRTLLRAMVTTSNFVRSPGLEKLENGAAATVISNNFCLLDQIAAMVIVERMSAVRTEELVFLELCADELTRAEGADDLE